MDYPHADLTNAPLLITDDLAMRKLRITAAEDPLEIVMRRHGRASTMLTSNRPVEDWGKLLGDTPAVTAMLDRLLEHGFVVTLRAEELADEGAPQLAPGGATSVNATRPCGARLAGFEVSTEAGSKTSI